MQAGLDLILAIDRVRRGQERAIGLAAEHIIARRRRNLVGRVRLAARELALRQRAFEAFDIRFHPRGQPRLVEHVGALGRDGAAEGLLCVERHWSNTITDRAASPFLILRSEEHTSELQSLMRISYAVFCLKK